VGTVKPIRARRILAGGFMGNAVDDLGIQSEVQTILRKLTGSVGIAIKALESNSMFLHNEQMVAPAASTIKVHILIELFKQAKAGKHSLEEFIEIPVNRDGAEWQTPSSGILKDLRSIQRLSLMDVATLMMAVSDNVATNLLIDLLGAGNIQTSIEHLGLKSTKLQRRMMDLEAKGRGLENVTSPHDMMITLQRIARYEILDRNSCDTILDILSKCQDTFGVRRLIPEDVRIEHKTGELFGVCNDVGVVRIPVNSFIFSIMANSVNLVQGWDTIAELGKLFYDHFTSQSPR
jgi:beta-lactamase class A